MAIPVKNQKIYVTNRPGLGGYAFLIADGTTTKDIYTCATTEGERITGIIITGVNAKTVTFYMYNGTTSYRLGAIAVVANSGTDGAVAATDGLSATLWPGITRDNASNRYRLLDNGWKIQAKLNSAVAADGELSIVVLTEKFTKETDDLA